jgi:nucleoside phosphorylase
MQKENFIEFKYEELPHLFNEQLILLVTVTDIELEETRSKLTSLNGYTGVIKVFKNNYTYYIGKFGKYAVALVQTGSMGSMSSSGSIITVKTALENMKSKIVIMIGIAFGVDKDNQNIGDVLLSETIIPYNLKRVGKNKIIPRGIEEKSSSLLINRFKSITTWENLLENNNKAKKIIAKILSGEELIDNITRRNELLKDFPEAKGGEMEGAGVAAACRDQAEWIIVKGICDFADGEKRNDKKKKQQIAIESAVSLCLELFASETAFREKGITPYCETSVFVDTVCSISTNQVLFEVYRQQNEPYYLEREEDIIFNQKLSQFGIWIYGDTGCGKSNLILRNLINNKSDYISITLGSYVGEKIVELFAGILNAIQEKIGNDTKYPNYKSFHTCCKSIVDELESNYKDKPIIIYLDEIPIDTKKEYQQFTKSLFALVNEIHLINGLEQVRFILSSIHNPIIHIQKSDQKIHEYLHFLPLKYWESPVIQDLIMLIEKYLQINLSQSVKTNLVEQAKGSPRFIKKFFKNVLLKNKRADADLLHIIQETDNELKQFGNE